MAEGQRSATSGTGLTPSAGERLRAWALVAAWILVILVFSQSSFSAEETGALFAPLMRFLGVPAHLIEPLHFLVRKSAHLLEYALLGGLAVRALSLTRPGAPAVLLGLALAIGVASLDEINQASEPTRTATPRDVLLDGAGAALGVLVRQRWQALRTPPLR